MGSHGHRAVVQRLLDCLNNDRLDALDQVVAEDYTQRNPSVTPGREGLRELFAGLRQAFPDINVSIEETVVEDDRVATLTIARGTHQGPFLDIPATGRSVEVASLDIYWIRDGLIVEHNGRFDELGMLKQLGITHDLSWRGHAPS